METVVLGAKEVQHVFETLEPKLQRRALRTVFRRLGNIAKDEAARGAPVKTGMLKRSLKVRSIKRNRGGRVGVNVISSFKGGNQYYGTFLEYGTKDRVTKSGRRTGRVVAKRWMESAFERKASQMLSEGQDLLKSEILRLAEQRGGGL